MSDVWGCLAEQPHTIRWLRGLSIRWRARIYRRHRTRRGMEITPDSVQAHSDYRRHVEGQKPEALAEWARSLPR
jgi:hypothetical protein